jgi:HD-GYP domain-containing protein (c-di-GMP phosphodiesterase class II)
MFRNLDLFRKSNLEKPEPQELNQVVVYNAKDSDIDVLTSTISSLNLNVFYISDPSVLIEHFNKNSPISIVADCDDNLEYGLSLFRAIRSTKHVNHIPVIFICNLVDELERKLMQVGNHFSILPSPVEHEPLFNRIELIVPKRNWSKMFLEDNTQSKQLETKSQLELYERSIENIFLKRKSQSSETPGRIEPRAEKEIQTESFFSIPIPSKFDQPQNDNPVSSVNIKQIMEQKPTPLKEPELQSPKSEINSNVEENLYDEIAIKLENQLVAIDNDLPVNLQTLKDLVQRLVTETTINSDLERRAIIKSGTLPLQNRILNMTIFSLLIGKILKLDESELQKIALVGLFHDLGMRKVSKSLLLQKRALDAEEYKHVMRHLDHTAAIIQSAQNYNSETDDQLISISNQIHEREDGSGYPNQLVSNQINIVAKVISVADRFEAMNHPRNYRTSFLSHFALQEMIKLKEKEFPPVIIKSLVTALSIFPINSYVQLSNSHIGRVTSINPKQPLRPILDILVNEKNETLNPPISFDLKKSPFIHISRTLTHEEIEKLVNEEE